MVGICFIHLSTLAGVSAVMLASTMPGAAARADDVLNAYRDKARVLAVVALDASDARLTEQHRLFEAMKAGARERDLVLVEAVGHSAEAQALRGRFGIGRAEFRAVLIGKDGDEKLTSAVPIGPDQLFPLIDSMPMRQDEMRRSRR